jgi:ATP-binding protein involved in chromosome partitioning
MFQQLGIEVLGVVENMSYFIGDDGKEYDIFGRGGAERMAQEMGVPFLGMVPINMALRENSDLGDPTANFKPGTKLAEELDKVVRRLAGQVSLKSRATQQPTMSIS